MSIEVIDTLEPTGQFPVVRASHVGVTDEQQFTTAAERAGLADLFASILASIGQGGAITFGAADGSYAFKIGAAGVSFVADPGTATGKQAAYTEQLASLISQAVGDGGLTIGGVDGSYAFNLNADGVDLVADPNSEFGQLLAYVAQLRGGGGAIPNDAMILLLGSGQSTDNGTNNNNPTAITTSPVAGTYMFNGGVRPMGAAQTRTDDPATSGENLELNPAFIDHLVPLVGKVDGGSFGETYLETLAGRIATATGREVIAATLAIGGASLQMINKGTKPYENYLKTVRRAKAIAASRGKPVYVIAPVNQGEADSGNPDPAPYLNGIVPYSSDLASDVTAITGQDELHVFLAQISSLNADGVPIAQWLAGRDNANIHCVGPRYDLPYSDLYHFTSPGYTLLGDLFWPAIKTVIFDGLPWTPLQPVSAIRTGTTIDIMLEGQVGDIVLDTSQVPAAQNYGIEYADNSNSATISNVALIAGGIRVTLSAVPTGANPRVRAAYSHTGSLPAPNGCARTNIADQSPMIGTHIGRAMPKRLVHFELPVS